MLDFLVLRLPGEFDFLPFPCGNKFSMLLQAPITVTRFQSALF